MKNISKYFSSALLISLYGIAITIPFSYKISNPWIVLMFASWLLLSVSKKSFAKSEEWSKWDKLSYYSLISFFLIHLIALIYTDNIDAAWKGIEGKLSLIVFPIVLFNYQLEKKQVWKLLQVFTLSICLATLYLLGHSALNYFNKGSWLIYHDFTSPFAAHAVFYSYYLFLSIVLSTYILLNHQLTKVSRAFYFFVILVSLTGLVFSASKNVTIVSIFFALLLLLKRYLKRGVTLKELSFLFITIIALAIIGSNLNTVQSRMSELFSGSGMENYHRIRAGETISESDNHTFNGTSLRLTFWYLGIHELIEEDRLMIGLSPGDRRDKMNEKYLEAGLRPYQNYNLHNQFIQVVVELGLMGLFLYLLVYAGFIGSAIKSSNSLLLIFLTATIIFQLTESILERNKSIVFFVFFFTLLHQLSNSTTNEDRHIGH